MIVGVIGAGSWGTTLAALLSENLPEVMLWSRRKEVADEINRQKTNQAYLPGITLPENIYATSDVQEMSRCSLLFIAVPSKYFREVLGLFLPYLKPETKFVSLTKGIESDSLKRMSEIIKEVTGASDDSIAVLSGPNHAEEVIKKIPTATVVASKSKDFAQKVQAILMRNYFRVYTHDDVIGVEVAGAVKNVLAIAVGISDGIGYGDNTKAALITRGLAEMVRLGKKMGANPLTFLGLSGIGDLIATATSKHSRNRNFGEKIGKGLTVKEALFGSSMFVEGVINAKSILRLAQKHDVDMPITREVYLIIYEGKDPKESVSSLMLRAPKPEIEMMHGDMEE